MSELHTRCLSVIHGRRRTRKILIFLSSVDNSAKCLPHPWRRQKVIDEPEPMLSACKAPGEVSLYEDHRNYRWSPGRAGIRTRPDLSARSTRGLVRLCRLGLVEARSEGTILPVSHSGGGEKAPYCHTRSVPLSHWTIDSSAALA